MPATKRPHRGSKAFYPRKRASRIYPTINTYPQVDKPKVLGFAGYKTGMLHAIAQQTNKSSPNFGQEIQVPVTILECPPLRVLGVRAYTDTVTGLKTLTEAWTKDLPKQLVRKIKVGKVKEEKISDIEKNLQKISRVRLIVSTQPQNSGIRKKTPELFELEIGGKDAKEKINFAKQFVGKEIKIEDVMKAGEFVDVIAVTKGKGTAGPVKRFGVRIQNRHAKQKLRHVGAIGAQVPRRVLWTAPLAGQMGFQTRTEFNKRILKIAEPKEVLPAGGFNRYGLTRSNVLLIEGSVPGSKKRLVMLRSSMRNIQKPLTLEIRQIVKGE